MAKKAKPTSSSNSIKGRKSQPTIPETPEPEQTIQSETPSALENVEEAKPEDIAAESGAADTATTIEIPLKPRNPSALNLLSCQIVNRYEGELQDGVNGSFMGQGNAEFVSNNHYKGDFHEGCMHGQGSFKFAKTGAHYTGDFFLNKITGKGKIEYRNGATYEGQLMNGQRHGDGIMHASNGASYTGQWLYGKRHGTGSAIYPDGSRYNGNWVEDKRNGNGIQEYTNGDNYVGDWLDDRPHGTGTMRWRAEIYFGQWYSGIPNGKGTYTWIQTTDLAGHSIDARTATADTIERCLNNQYVGDFVKGRRHGLGRFFYSSGAIYSGQWQNNKKHGAGKYTFKSGRVFSGSFEDDHMVVEDEGELMGKPMILRKTPDGVGASRPQTANTECCAVVPLAEAPGFTLDLNSLLGCIPSAEVRHSTSQAIVNLFIDSLSAMKRVYSKYANIGAKYTNSNAILTRLQYWQMLVDLRQYIYIPIPALDRFVGVNRPVSSVYGPDEQFLFREFLTSICIVGKFVGAVSQPTTDAVSNFMEIIKILDNCEEPTTNRQFFTLKFHQHLDKFTAMYDKLSSVAPKNKRVTAKILLVFLKAIGIICDGPRLPRDTTEADTTIENPESRASSHEADDKSRHSAESVTQPAIESETPNQSTPKPEVVADTYPLTDSPLSSQAVLQLLTEIDPHLVLTSSSSDTDSDDPSATVYQLDREFCLLDVGNFCINLAEHIFSRRAPAENAPISRPASTTVVQQPPSSNGTLFEAIEKENTSSSLRASMESKTEPTRDEQIWAWVQENLVKAAELYKIPVK